MVIIARILLIFLTAFAGCFVELIVNYIQSKKKRELLNGYEEDDPKKLRKTLFSYTTMWSALTYFIAGISTLGAFELVQLIELQTFKDFSLFSLSFWIIGVLYIIMSGTGVVFFEILIGWIYTFAKVRHWDYRKTAINRVNLNVANFFAGQTDIPHMIVYYSVQPIAYLAWYFIR